jgi:16S rRNA (cytidine1402-2'-O)-methyltransferase
VKAGTLYVVATPIGNLEDITFRALRILREVALVAAEDTRRSGQLLRHFGIATPLVSLHQHNEGQKTELLLSRLRAGESVAVVSDAGTPAVSDPGATLVAAARAAGLRVEPIPGASAVMAAVSAAGLSEDVHFGFFGFPPVKAKDREFWFSEVLAARSSMAVVFFEAPHRILATLEDLSNRSLDRIIVFRELTKLHETSYDGAPGVVAGMISPVAGEFTVVIPRRSAEAAAVERPSDEEVRRLFGQITDKKARDAARRVAAATGLTANEVYDIVRRTGADD